MLMNEFKVGDKVIRVEGTHMNMREGDKNVVSDLHSNGTHVQLCGRFGWHKMSSLAHDNPNLITVSSLDYNDSTTLTQEDKQIIKEYLYENS